MTQVDTAATKTSVKDFAKDEHQAPFHVWTSGQGLPQLHGEQPPQVQIYFLK